ncbi:MAG: hypothetical protein IJZ16_13090 [Clostridia bacterium]|nr:hypothetical protein [Clostridia bacterium]
MNICVSCKDYFKESKEVQKAIVSGVETLYGRIQNYEEQNIDFNQIFNDDKVKYDKHGQFYTFKFQKSNMQLRVLYSYIIVDCIPVVIVADFFIKKRNSKDYIYKFDSVNKANPLDLYRKSKVVYSI